MPNATGTADRATAPARPLSEHCELGRRAGYESLHRECKRDADYTLPGHPRIIVTPRCGCSCHGGAR